jgi:hypothetical protein
MGQLSEKRVTALDWETEPFKNPKRVDWSLPIPVDQLPKLMNGFRSGDMDDKWFIYADEPDAEGHAALHMYRSFTGYKVIELAIEIAGKGEDDEMVVGKAHITAITWETDEKTVGDDPSENMAKYMALAVCNNVLGVKLVEEIEETYA